MLNQQMTIRGFWFVPINDGYGKEECPMYDKRCSRNCKECTQGDALIEVERNKKLASDLLKRNEELIRKFNLR